jgi:hypothetical protein
MPWGPAWQWRGWGRGWGRPWAPAPWWYTWRGRGLCWRLFYDAVIARSLDEARLLEDYKRELEYEIEELKKELELVEERLRELRRGG